MNGLIMWVNKALEFHIWTITYWHEIIYTFLQVLCMESVSIEKTWNNSQCNNTNNTNTNLTTNT